MTDNEEAPIFSLPTIHANPTGWGPAPTDVESPLTRFVGMPFQIYNKCDRVGRIVDWLGVDRYKKTERYNERLYGSSQNAGTQFDYVHDNEDSNFQLVDSTKPQKPQRPFRRAAVPFRKLMQRDQERREQQYYNQSNKMKRSIAKEQMRAYKLWQRRGGMRSGQPNRPPGNRRFGDRQAGKNRMPSVQVRSDWKVLQELDFQRLSKLSLPNREDAIDIKGETYGLLYFYDKALDKVSVKNPVVLQRCGGIFYNTTTTDDPVIHKLAQKQEGNVFATDIILATLMAAQRSVYSWDIVAHRVGDSLFLDKRDTGGFSNPVDALTVSETSPDPPTVDPSVSLNNAKDLATEALYINQNFRRQVLKRNEKPLTFDHERAPFEDDSPDARAECCYRYRKWNLGEMTSGDKKVPLVVVARTELDGALVPPSGNTKDAQKLTIKAFNEWDSSLSGGVQWRTKLDVQKASVLATEMKNNGSKLSKWTLQAILAGADYLKFGYVSRVSTRNAAQHEILGTQQFRPNDLANNLALNLDNCWGVLRVICEFLLNQPAGKYLLLKDPTAPVVRIYDLPDGTFESSDDEDEESGEEEEDD
ncbi:Eukaryotic translation initiation factor 3 subunit D [Aphelenchoides besseyi]|nr:Eukaryotic translation initiation factor 3 subunit D [Aphelenchoides besseyi]KAI6223977.1 Eukaryotic translation initiation factor 3 subunit D [Aphelenchoides besseyi]